MLNSKLKLYETINEKRDSNAIPKNEDQTIQYAFQPDLLDNVFHLLFNEAVGRPINAAQERIIEIASNQLLEALYPEYETLMLVGNWTSSLGKYRNALKHLELTHERQGQVVVEGTKDEIAELFTLSNTGLDTFISNFSSLLVIQQPFPNQREAKEGKKGAVRFQLHSLEEKIKRWLAESSDVQSRQIGQHLHQVNSLPTNQVYLHAQELGYREKEIDEVLNLMEERGLIVQDRRGTIREGINQAPSIDELATDIETWQQDLKVLQTVFNQNQQLRTWAGEAEKIAMIVNQTLRQKPDDEKAISARRAVQTYRRQLDDFVKDRHQDLAKDIDRFSHSLPQPNPQHSSSLNNSIMGGVSYVEQVNDLRSRLSRQYTTLKNEAESYHHQIDALAAPLKSPDLAIPTLVKLAHDYKKLQSKNVPLQQKCEAFAKDFEQLNEWGRLVQQGSNLSDQIRELGDAVRGEREKFQKLAQDIMGHLSALKIEALPNAPTYENRLREIAEEVRRIKTQASENFANHQERYQATLIGSLKFPRERLWISFSYNPADPDDSYRRLTQSIQNALKELRQRLHGQQRTLQDDIRFVLQSPALKAVEEKEAIEVKGKSLLQTFEQVAEQLVEIELKVNDASIINDFPVQGEGAFHYLLDMFASVLDKVTGETAKEVQQLRSQLGDFTLEGDEETVMAILPASGHVELSELRQKLSFSEDALWKALRGLYTKRRIRLPIETIHYD